jgi:hypothetical protein
MKTLVRSILSLTLFAVLAAPSFAATLRYTAVDGKAVIDPTDGGTNPTGKVLGYNLASAGKFFVDPARTSAFPPPAQTFYENTASVIGDNDLSFAGVSTPINLGKLFVDNINAPNASAGQAQLAANFTNQFFLPSLGGGEVPMTLTYVVPEPATEGPAMAAPNTVDQTTSVSPLRGPQVILNPYVTQSAVAAGQRPAGATPSKAL